MERFTQFLKRANLETKQYQIDGVKWCLNNELKGYTVSGITVKGGLVADEMGLGKTIMMLGIIVSNFKFHTLIVLPRTLMEQWRNVFRKFLGHDPLIYHGASKKNIGLEQLKKSPIVVTTYGLLDGDSILKEMKWSRIIYDEAHHLRNANTKISIGSKHLQSEIKWLVTGTPIQNRKNDFYALCQAIGIPSNYYTNPDNILELVTKFILKRTKQDAGIILPNLRTHEKVVEWNNKHEEKLARSIHSILDFSNKTSLENNRVATLLSDGNTLPLYIYARQMCIYPPLIQNKIRFLMDKHDIDTGTENINVAIESTSKMNALVETLVSRKDNGKPKLVFCHYRGEIDIIRAKLIPHNIRVNVFDGRVSNKRRTAVLNSTCDVLVLQIQTGCEGLNLQQFSEVYFVSPHWNPAVEDQSVARCHRIGQTDDIDVFRFVMKGFDGESERKTLDEYSQEVQRRKREVVSLLTPREKVVNNGVETPSKNQGNIEVLARHLNVSQ